MKLELKHLAPYLPYGLKCWSTTIILDSKTEDRVYEMGLISMRGVLKGTGKPILRPLSDLTKEIEGNCYWLLIEETEMRYFRLKNSQIDKLCVKTYNNLLKHHFDVFNLIPQNLAIDINTL